MIGWEEKLNLFLSDFEHSEDIIGVLVCGSYVTGNPSRRSDLDTHIILSENSDYRERGNRVIDGLLIEYFANPPKQILKYFAEDYGEDLTSQVQFATGKIMLDKTGEVKMLKEKALAMIDDYYKNEKSHMTETEKYFLWDMADDLWNSFENDKNDFDFLYYNFLNRLISAYMNAVGRPYALKAIYGNITDKTVRDRYLLKELPDRETAEIIAECINSGEKSKEEKMRLYQRLTDTVLSGFGGFNIGNYKFKSKIDA